MDENVLTSSPQDKEDLPDLSAVSVPVKVEAQATPPTLSEEVKLRLEAIEDGFQKLNEKFESKEKRERDIKRAARYKEIASRNSTGGDPHTKQARAVRESEKHTESKTHHFRFSRNPGARS